VSVERAELLPAPCVPRACWGLERFAFGLALGGAATPAEWQRDLDQAVRAEAAGLHSVWVPEMHFARHTTASPLLVLAAIAARTRRLRLATTSLLLPIHDPHSLADELAALDRASGGRLLVGLGRGFRAPLFRAFAIDPASKRDRFDAALDAMLEAWRGADARVRMPLQRPSPPLAVAAFGPRGLAQAARRALPYLPSPLEDVAQLERNLQLHREGLPAGFDVQSLVVPVMRTVHIAGGDGEARRVLAALESETRASVGRAPRALARATARPIAERAIVGTRNEVVDRLAALRERLGIDLLIVRPRVPGLAEPERHAAFDRLLGDVCPALS